MTAPQALHADVRGLDEIAAVAVVLIRRNPVFLPAPQGRTSAYHDVLAARIGRRKNARYRQQQAENGSEDG
jgi:hypothetical protein